MPGAMLGAMLGACLLPGCSAACLLLACSVQRACCAPAAVLTGQAQHKHAAMVILLGALGCV